MGDATYGPKVYKNDQGDRIVITTGGVLDMDGGIMVSPVREAALYGGSSGDLPAFGDVVVGNTSGAIVYYQLPVPESSVVGSVLNLHALPYDDTIGGTTHWYIAGTSGNSWCIGNNSTANSAVVWDSTYEQAFSFKLIAVSTSMWRACLPGTTGSLRTGLLLGSTLTT